MAAVALAADGSEIVKRAPVPLQGQSLVAAGRWKVHRTLIADGPSFSFPDSEGLVYCLFINK